MERTKTLIQHISSLIVARANCQQSGNDEWFQRHSERLDTLARDFLPRGSGIDSGTTIDLDASNGSKIVLHTSFHHMDEAGGYDGWTEHTITLKPAFDGFDLAIGGRDRNGIKEYLGEVFHSTLSNSVIEDETGYRWTK